MSATSVSTMCLKTLRIRQEVINMKKTQGIGERKGMQSPLVQKKPKAERDREGLSYSDKCDSLPAGKFEERLNELKLARDSCTAEKRFDHARHYRAMIDALKEGYSLGKQDRDAELIKAVSELPYDGGAYIKSYRKKVLEILKKEAGR